MQITHAVVKFGYPPVCDGQAGKEDEVDERVDVRLFREIEGQPTFFVVPGPLQVADHITEKR